MAEVVIAGGGFAGLAGSIFLARRGHTVTVVERDGSPLADATVDDDAARWRRAGAGQRHQSHVLLGRARHVLLEEAPDVLAALLARGVREEPAVVGAGGVEGAAMLLGRRLVVEAEVRRCAEREPGVVVRSGDAVVGLRATPGDVPIVTGARLQSGDVLPADLVVDAGGRRSALPTWLADIDARPPVDEVQELGFLYLTRYYRLRPGCARPPMRVPGATALDYANVLAFGGDNDTFSLTIALSVDDPHRQALREPARHTRFLEAVPLTAPWLAAGEPITEIFTMARIENRRRRIVDAAGPVVGGLVPLGDASLHTNPTQGRGISMAFWQAQHLAATVASAHRDPVELVRGFDAWTQDHLGVWFDTQVTGDATILERLAAGLRGERMPLSDHPSARFAAAAFACAPHDAVVGAAAARVVHLFESPAEAFGAAAVVERVSAFLAADPPLERPADQPTRAEFEAIATA
ncbi:MAG: FAD-dependent oxidoreductase [Acidimicrobiales bacterium]|nr:FAD-dependent oxidoreductase [Acidimicrobiales bacterium]